MKYLFIFFPFFAFGQGDTSLYSVRFDSIITHDSFFAAPNSSGFLAERNYGIYKPKVIESFKHNGAYYELHDNGWYKEILPDTTPTRIKFFDYKEGNVKIKGDSVFRWSETTWKSCDQHIGGTESYQREKMDTSEVKLLIWNGCALAEIKAVKLTGYNLDRSNFYYDRNGEILRPTKTDFLFVYISEDKWIKNSHVIKEL